MELNLAEHILYLPKITHFIKVVLLCHFQRYAFFLLWLLQYFVVRNVIMLYTLKTLDTTRGGGGWEGEGEEDFQDGPVFCFNYALSCSCLQSVQTVLTGQDSAWQKREGSFSYWYRASSDSLDTWLAIKRAKAEPGILRLTLVVL